MIPIKPGKSLGKSDVIFNNSMLSSTWKNTNRPLIMCARDEKVNTFDGESNFKYELDKTASFDISVKATYDGKDINVTSSVLPCLDTDEGTEYSVAYVLTADGLKNEKWGQANRVGEWNDQVFRNMTDSKATNLLYTDWNYITHVTYANRKINYYIKKNKIAKKDRTILKKYVETDCKLLCAVVTAANGFVRESVGDDVSEERVNVISAAYSLVGKVGYFWGGKSTVIGEDPGWGTSEKVSAEGSKSTAVQSVCADGSGALASLG